MSKRKIILKTPDSERPLEEGKVIITSIPDFEAPSKPPWDIGQLVDPDTFVPIENSLHKDCSYHREQLFENEHCSCFNCFSIFGPKEIKEWTDDSQTAICPKCGIDSVLPEWVETDILHLMYKKWFNYPDCMKDA